MRFPSIPFVCVVALLFLYPRGLGASEVSVEGTVLAGEGPLSGAEIQLVPWTDEVAPGRFVLRGREPQPVASTRSGVDGAFRLMAPFMGLWKVQVEAPGRQGREMLLGPLFDALKLPAVDLPPAAELKVRVTDAEGRTPLQAVVAWPVPQDEDLSPAGGWRPALSVATTDREGFGRLWLGLDGSHKILVVARGFLPTWVEGVEAGKVSHVALRPGLLRAVEVVDLEGNPLPQTWLYSAGIPLPLAQTNARGMALIPTPREESMALTLISPERHGTWELVPSETGAQGAVATLRLTPPRTFRGKLVERRTARPVSGALIWSRPSTHGDFAVTDGDGAFKLPGTGEPPVSLAVATRGSERAADRVAGGMSLPLVPCGKRPQRSPPLRLSQGTPDGAGASHRPAPELCYEPVAAQRRLGVGRVVGGDDAPIEGAEVLWTRSLIVEEGPAVARFQDLDRKTEIYATDEWGRFEVPAPLPGRYDLEVRAIGFGPVRVPAIEVPPGSGEVDLGVLTLGPGFPIEGWVVDAEGRAVAGAEILLSEPGAASAALEFLMSGVAEATTSDVHGYFVIRDLAPGGPFFLRVEKAGYHPRDYPALRVPMAESLEVVLTPTSLVSGRVIDEQGQGVPEALVTVHPQDSGADTGHSASSSSDGWFKVPGVRPGHLVIVAKAAGFRQVRLTGLQVEPGDFLEDVEITLERGVALFGTVRNDSGAAVAGATVMVLAPDSGDQSIAPVEALSRTDTSGHFRLLGMEAGQRLLVAEDDKGRRAFREVNVGQDPRQVDFTLEGGTDVSGWTRSEDGAPVAGATVILMDASGEGQSPEARTDRDGRFLFAGLPSGTYYLLAYAVGFAPARPGTPIEVENFPLSGLEVTLSPGLAVRGRVLGVAFGDLPRVRIRTPGVGSGATVGVDYEGHFTLPDLPSGEVLLEAQVVGSGRRARKRVLLPQASFEVTLDLTIGTENREEP